MRAVRNAVLVLLAVFVLSAPAPATEDASYRIWLDVEIDHEGRIVTAEPAGELPEFLSAALTASLGNISVEPATREGVPVPSTNGMYVEFGLVEHGGGLALEIRKHRVGPRRIRTVYPEYPPNELTKRHEGWVEVEFVVDEQGEPADIEMREASDAMFISAAMRAVRQWRYKPRTIEGQPVATPVKARVRFSADEDE